MSPILVALILILMALVIAYFVSRSRSSGGSGGYSFLEYVKNPSRRKSLGRRFHAEKAEVERLKKIRPDRLVAMLALPEFNRAVPKAIRAIGFSAASELAAALSNPAFRRPYQYTRRHSLDPEFPLIAVLDCLNDFAGPETAAPLSSLVADTNATIRKKVACVLGSIGADECLPALAISLADEDEYVRGYAMMGIARSAKGNRPTKKFKDEIFDLLQPLAWVDTLVPTDKAASTMLAIDRNRAIQTLASPEELHVSRDGLRNVLPALAAANVVVDEPVLLCLSAQLRRLPSERPYTSLLSATLALLALHDSDDSLRAIRIELDSPNQHIKQAAAIAFAARMGLRDPFGFLFGRVNESGWDTLTLPQQHVLAVRILIDEVNNGGFSQYFVNSSGDHWPIAREGLVALGAQSDLVLLDRALALFDRSKPSTNARRRHAQLARAVRRNDEAFEGIETLFYKDTDAREAQLLTYIMKHAQDFRASP